MMMMMMMMMMMKMMDEDDNNHRHRRKFCESLIAQPQSWLPHTQKNETYTKYTLLRKY